LSKGKIAIVGMGIAGAILSEKLQDEAYHITIFNKKNPSCSSRVAAGMFNSIIPRRVTKSWLSDELNPVIQEYYPSLETKLESTFFYSKDLLHIFEYVKEQNDWLSKANKEKFKGYFEPDPLFYPTNPMLHSPLGGILIKQAGYCHTGVMLDSFESYYKEKGFYVEGLIDSKDIESKNGKYYIDSLEFDKVIFCEGVENNKNKWFKDLPFKFAKGELLHVKIKGLELEEILLGGVFLIPWGGKDEYLLGSTFQWDFTHALPTEEAKEELLSRIKAYVPNGEIEILEHRAGIRPAVKDRRPLIGKHPEEDGIYIFNGFGSKAISLAPYFAKQMVSYLDGTEEIHEEVNVIRFLN